MSHAHRKIDAASIRTGPSGVPGTDVGDAAAPLVTIGISTYNRAAFTFPDALRSALAQTYGNLEVVVCDNASTDGTESFMTTQTDERLRYIRHPVNIGANANFEACLEHARGRYFLLLHDDDLLHPEFIDRAVEELRGREPGVVLGGVRLIDAAGRADGTVPSPPADLQASELFLAWFDRRFSFYFCSTLFHSDRLRSLGGFSTPENLFQDVVAIARLASRFGYVSVPTTAGSFRRHETNRGAAGKAMSWARDGAYLLEVLQEELPHDAERLRAAGAPYLSQTAYRYAAAEARGHERAKTYEAVYELFGRAYPPWRFEVRRQRRRLRRAVGSVLRRAGLRRPRPA